MGVHGTRPVLAVAAFLGPFVVTAVLYATRPDNVILVAACVGAAFAGVLLSIRLLGGNHVGSYNWLLVVALYVAVRAGQQWYLVAIVATFTVFFLHALDRYVGYFAPLFDPCSKYHRVLKSSTRKSGSD